jgi:hypothetical protein
MKQILRRVLLLSLLLALGTLTSGPVDALQALCVNCFQKCEHTTHSAHSRCSDFTGGCVAAGECSINLTVTP